MGCQFKREIPVTKDYFICVDVVEGMENRFVYTILPVDIDIDRLPKVAEKFVLDSHPDTDLSSATLKVIAFNPV